jgi:3-methylcrotonyl-CoA carboxylase alpha subunit
MIAKLIVRGPTRQAALQKMRAALESYEIGGPVTNIEFLKRLCVSPAFVAGELETGYIDKYRDELFRAEPVPDTAFYQAAIGLLLEERNQASRTSPSSAPQALVGTDFQERSYTIAALPADGKTTPSPTTITIQELSPTSLKLTLANSAPILATLAPTTPSTFTTFFPTARLDTTFLRAASTLTLWHHGHQHRFTLPPPPWIQSALAVPATANSVLAPMPCKVLRLLVDVGALVKRDQPLAVIESMKMETVIHSPVDGVIARVVRREGVSLPRLPAVFVCAIASMLCAENRCGVLTLR